MSEVAKERFQFFIQQALAEYDSLHAQVAEQTQYDSLKPLPVLLGSIENSQLMRSQGCQPHKIPETEVHMELLPQAMLPGSVQDSRLLKLETGHLEQLTEILIETDVESCKGFQHHPIEGTKTSNSDLDQDSDIHPITWTSAISIEKEEDSLTPLSVLPVSDENAEELPRLKIGQPDGMLDSGMSICSNMNFERDLNRHLTDRTANSSVKGFVAISLGDMPGALQNPHQVKDTLVRMSELQHAISFTSALSRLVGKATYKEHGLMASIAKSRFFEGLTMMIVILNGIWIAIDADYNQAGSLVEAKPMFHAIEHVFCLAFTVEIVIRFAAFSKKSRALCDPWFVFDASLVQLLLVETWIMPAVAAVSDGKGVGINVSVLRLLRVARLSRLARVIRAVPELRFMVKGVLQGARAVACTLGLLLGVLYVFGIALRQLSDNTNMGSKYFGTVPHAVFTLFLQGTLLDDIAQLFIEVYEESHLCAILLFIFVVVAAITLMSMLVGVLCNVMNDVAIREKDRMAVSYVKEQLLVALEELDENMDQHISKEEFVHLISNEKASHALKNVGVDVVHLVDYADYYFQSDKLGESFEEKWSFDQFIEEIMLVRGVNSATVRDTVELRKFIHAQNTSQNIMLKHVQENQTVLARNQAKLERLISRGHLQASHYMQPEQNRTTSGS